MNKLLLFLKLKIVYNIIKLFFFMKKTNKNQTKFFVVLKIILIVIFVFCLKIGIDKNFSSNEVAATTFFDFSLEIDGDKPTVEVGEAQTLEIDVYNDGGVDVTGFEDAVFSIEPNGTPAPDATCDGVYFGSSMDIDMSETPNYGSCQLIINAPGTYEIDLEGYENYYYDYLTTEYDSSADYHVTVVEGPDHLEVSGNPSQIAGAEQTITISAKRSSGDVSTSYSGDKTITISGPGVDGSKAPTCTDKNGTLIDLGSPMTLNFVDGIATCDLVLYKLENAEVDVDDGTLNSFSSPDYDLNVDVEVGYLKVEGAATQTSGTGQIITVSARNYNDAIISTYSGVKSMIFSGPLSEGSNHPKCKDKNDDFRTFGDGTDLEFTSGEADCEMVLYKVESTHVDVIDGAYDSFADPEYDLDVNVVRAPTDPNIYVDPLSHNFGSLNEGQGVEKTVLIKNTGEQTLNISEIILEGDAGFNINFSGGENPCNTNIFNLNYNESCTIGVYFQPPVVGLYSVVLNISSNDPDSPNTEALFYGNRNYICDHFDLKEKKENTLVFDVCIPKETEKSGPKIDEEDNRGTAIERAALKTKEKIEGEFKIEYLEEKPEDLEIPEAFDSERYLTYKHLEIDSDDFDSDDLEETTLDLLVESEWMEENDIGYIVFLHSEIEDELDAELKEVDSEYSYFEIYSEKFSPYWTILGEKNNLAPKIYINFLEHHFVDVAVNQSSDPVKVEISNIGNADLNMKRTYLDDINHYSIDRFPQDNPCGESKIIAPGERCNIAIAFNPKEQGELKNNLLVESNDPERPSLNVLFTGNGILPVEPPEEKTPIIELSLKEHKFSEVDLNTEDETKRSLNQDVIVYNRGNADLLIDDIDLSETDEYTIDLNPSNSKNPCGSIKKLEPGKSCDLRIIFKPRKPGEAETVLNVKSNDPNKPLASAVFKGGAKEAKAKELEPEMKKDTIESAAEEKELPKKENEAVKNEDTDSKEVSIFDFSTEPIPIATALGFGLLGIPFYQRRFKKAGVVFDAGTGKPLADATVELFGEQGKVLEVKTTDKTGNYFFHVTPGTYSIRVIKDGYKMISEKEIKYFSKYYVPVINEQTKASFEKDDNFSFAFPMIPEKKKALSYSIASNSGLMRILDNLFWAGFVGIIVATILYPVLYNFIVLGIYIFFIAIKFFYPKKPKWGVIKNKDNIPQPLVFVTAQSRDGSYVVRGLTDGLGRYALLLPKGTFDIELRDSDGRTASFAEQLKKEKILAKDYQI